MCVLVPYIVPHILDGLGYPFESRSSYSSIGWVPGDNILVGSGAKVMCLTA